MRVSFLGRRSHGCWWVHPPLLRFLEQGFEALGQDRDQHREIAATSDVEVSTPA
jgi:hypothetical protein